MSFLYTTSGIDHAPTPGDQSTTDPRTAPPNRRRPVRPKKRGDRPGIPTCRPGPQKTPPIGPGAGRAPADPWQASSNTTGTGPCPRARLAGYVTDKRTGEMSDRMRGCDRRDCPSCGPRMLRQHMAHFRDEWRGALGRHLFLTLTLRPEDADRLLVLDQVHALRSLFTDKLVRRLTRREGARPKYLAQVDRNGDHIHLHAIVETVLDPRFVAGQWIAAGGGIDHDARFVRPSEDDLAKVVGYVCKGGRWTGLGRTLCSRELGFNSAKAKSQRRAFAEAKYGTERRHEVYERVSVEGLGKESVGADAPSTEGKEAPQMELFTSTVPTPTRAVSPVRGGRYALVTTYDPATELAAVLASRIVRRGGQTEYVPLAHVSSKVHGRWFLRRRSARDRQRYARSAP